MLSLIPLLATLAAAALLALGVRPQRQIRPWLRWTLVAALAGSELVEQIWPLVDHDWVLAQTMPVQLSDLATVLAVVALAWPRWHMGNVLTYFWGLAAGCLGLAFPAIGAVYPSPLYFAFYVDHGALLTTGLMIAAAGGLRIGWRAIMFAWGATMMAAIVAGTANLLTGGDYMFLRVSPPTWSPLMVMGPWPWYVAVAWGLCPLLFFLFALPWWLGKLRPPLQPLPWHRAAERPSR
jgi:hypothetical integral membrane protein (TIGR02206 family)